MAKQKIEIEVDVPDGYEATGEFRVPSSRADLYYFEGMVGHGDPGRLAERVILRRVKQYREPVLPADAWKTCEFSDNETNWFSGLLNAWVCSDMKNDGKNWNMVGHGFFKHCRIEKEPNE